MQEYIGIITASVHSILVYITQIIYMFSDVIITLNVYHKHHSKKPSVVLSSFNVNSFYYGTPMRNIF